MHIILRSTKASCHVGDLIFVVSSVTELKPSTYEQFVLHQKRGHMTVVFLLDGQDDMTEDWMKIVKSYARFKDEVLFLRSNAPYDVIMHHL